MNMVITRAVIINYVGLSLSPFVVLNSRTPPSNSATCKGILEPSVSRKREPGLIKPRCIGCNGIFSPLSLNDPD